MLEVTFELPGRHVACTVRPGVTLAQAAEVANVPLNIACGGNGSCGGCAVDLLSGACTDSDGEPPPAQTLPRRVLACRTRLLAGPVRVRVGRHSLISAGEKVVIDFDHAPSFSLEPPVRKHRLKLPAPTLADQRSDVDRVLAGCVEAGADGPVLPALPAVREAPPACRAGRYEVTATLAEDGGAWRLVRVEPGDTAGRAFALAVDVGTTTVVCSLVDLVSGRIVDSASGYNQQVRRCVDVISRIAAAAAPAELETLRRLVVDETINRLAGLLRARHGLSAQDLVRVAVAGNTVMSHLLLGVDPTHLGAVPFQPAFARPPALQAAELGLDVHPGAVVDVLPATAGYIGGDITADMYVCGIALAERPTLLVDIGTNAEIVVGTRDRLIACAAPAGPAFEGHALRCGMRAGSGAIDRVRIDPRDLSCRCGVIDGGPAAGVCGSGLLDFLGQARLAGLLTPAGRFDRDRIGADGTRCPHVKMLDLPDGRRVPAYVLAEGDAAEDGVPVAVTEADVAALLQAKGVVFAAVQIAVQRLGLRFADLHRVYLAGGFARHLNLRNCIAAGMLPDLPHERFTFIGNGSLAGAYLALVDRAALPAMRRSITAPQVIELNLDPDFMDAYTMAMLLPHGDPDLFPSLAGNA